MRIVVLGAKGMLGSDLLVACKAAPGVKAIGFDVDTLDITDPKQVKKLPGADWVVNCAAYTRVDDAESHRDQAYAINCEGARHVANVCTRRRVRVAYISTDYVFDGTRTTPYVEHDQTGPINIYGASKLAGEKAVRSESAPHLVIRTQSLFGANGPNFAKSIMGKLGKGEPLRVVDDQTSSPTYTKHLADAILRLLVSKASGVVHIAGSRFCTWRGFAQAIADRIEPGSVVEALKTADLNLPADRPAYSVLDTRKYRMLTGHVMPTWEQGLEAYLKEEGVTV